MEVSGVLLSGISLVAALALARVVVLVAFTIITGVVQGRSTGKYPKVGEWTEALRRLLTGGSHDNRPTSGRRAHRAIQ
jgi:hypothetical protein